MYLLLNCSDHRTVTGTASSGVEGATLNRSLVLERIAGEKIRNKVLVKAAPQIAGKVTDFPSHNSFMKSFRAEAEIC